MIAKSLKGLNIKQSIVFSGSYTLINTYMAMLPLAQAASNILIPNNNYIPISASNKRLYDVSDAILYKSDGKVQTRFYVTDFKFSETNFNFLCVDNGGTQYNKCYFVNCIDPTNVSNGDVWTSSAYYEFIISD